MLICGYVMNVVCLEKGNKFLVCMVKCELLFLCGYICNGICLECSFNYYREC